MFLIFLSTAAIAQPPQMRIIKRGPGNGVGHEMTEDNIFAVPELSAMIGQDGDKLVVENIMEVQMRPKGYEKTDLLEGDVILMANGKKAGSLNDLKEIYKGTSVGSTVKIGIKRKDEMMIVSFVKADPKDLPQMRMIVSNGPDEDFIGIPQIGLLFGSKGKKVVIKNVMPNAAKDIPDVDAKEGDVIMKINGSLIQSFKDFQKAYEKIAVGDHVEIITSRFGKLQTIGFSKPKNEGKTIIRRQGIK
jgi:S1-C subfamily serine protease